MSNAGKHRLTIERVDKWFRVICRHCDRPFLEIEIAKGDLKFESKHGSAKHSNTLTPDDLRMIAAELWRTTHPPERW